MTRNHTPPLKPTVVTRVGEDEPLLSRTNPFHHPERRNGATKRGSTLNPPMPFALNAHKSTNSQSRWRGRDSFFNAHFTSYLDIHVYLNMMAANIAFGPLVPNFPTGRVVTGLAQCCVKRSPVIGRCHPDCVQSVKHHPPTAHANLCSLATYPRGGK